MAKPKIEPILQWRGRDSTLGVPKQFQRVLMQWHGGKSWARSGPRIVQQYGQGIVELLAQAFFAGFQEELQKATQKRKPLFALLQGVGSSESYAHTYTTYKGAERHRKKMVEAGINCSKIVQVPEALLDAAHKGELASFLDSIL